MKNLKSVTSLSFFIFIVVSISLGNASQFKIAQSTLPLTTDTKDQCSTSTVHIYIETSPAGTNYNTSTLHAPTSTCVRITFHNKDHVDHTFRIDANSANGIAYFNIYTNPTDIVSSNFMTPKNAMSITYYCAETGHYDKGMHGILIVGQTSSTSSTSSSNSISSTKITQISPGFTLSTLFMSLSLITSITVLQKQKRKEF